MSALPEDRVRTPLSGWCVGLLRADAARTPLARALVRDGARVIALPALSLRAAAGLADVRAEMQASCTADAWVFASPAAVRFTWSVQPDFRLSRATQVFAVGPGTAAALARRGVVARFPEFRHDSEGLLALPAIKELQGRVALIKAPGGRALLADALRERGLDVQQIHVYRRSAARWDRRHGMRVRHFFAHGARALLISTSAEALAAWTQLAGAVVKDATGVTLLVSSARLAEHARSLGFVEVRLAGGSTPDALQAHAREVACRDPGTIASTRE